MPSSGSTTSRRASSTSATLAGLAGGRGLGHCSGSFGLVQGIGERHPRQEGALDARGVLRDAGEGDAVADLLLVAGVLALAREHRAHRLERLAGVGDGLAGDLLGEDRGRGDADRAAHRVVGHVLDDGVVTRAGDVHPQGHLVAAGGVDVVHLGLERVAQTGAHRALVVLEDELLVEVHQTATSSPNIAGTRSSASSERVDLAGGGVGGEAGPGARLRLERPVQRPRAVVADPHGDAAVVEHLADVVGVHAVDDERHRSPALAQVVGAEHAHPRTLRRGPRAAVG